MGIHTYFNVEGNSSHSIILAADRGGTVVQHQGRNMENIICAESKKIKRRNGRIGEGGRCANKRRKN
jgi:hypothetical protein